MPQLKKRTTTGTRREHDLATGVLRQIASVMLRLGYDSPYTESILRSAFVNAARNRAEASGKRVTQSQLALIAGVSRKDIRSILADRSASQNPRKFKRRSRVEEVIHGWTSDPNYCDSKGRPKSLTFDGAHSQFSRLVRDYGRDVTARTLREDLVSSRQAKLVRGRVVLDAASAVRSVLNLAAISDLRYLSEHFRTIGLTHGRRSYVTRSVTIHATDAHALRVMLRKATQKIEYLMSSMRSLDHPVRHDHVNRHHRSHRIVVTATLSAESRDDHFRRRSEVD